MLSAQQELWSPDTASSITAEILAGTGHGREWDLDQLVPRGGTTTYRPVMSDHGRHTGGWRRCLPEPMPVCMRLCTERVSDSTRNACALTMGCEGGQGEPRSAATCAHRSSLPDPVMFHAWRCVSACARPVCSDVKLGSVDVQNRSKRYPGAGLI